LKGLVVGLEDADDVQEPPPPPQRRAIPRKKSAPKRVDTLDRVAAGLKTTALGGAVQLLVLAPVALLVGLAVGGLALSAAGSGILVTSSVSGAMAALVALTVAHGLFVLLAVPLLAAAAFAASLAAAWTAYSFLGGGQTSFTWEWLQWLLPQAVTTGLVAALLVGVAVATLPVTVTALVIMAEGREANLYGRTAVDINNGGSLVLVGLAVAMVPWFFIFPAAHIIGAMVQLMGVSASSIHQGVTAGTNLRDGATPPR